MSLTRQMSVSVRQRRNNLIAVATSVVLLAAPPLEAVAQVGAAGGVAPAQAAVPAQSYSGVGAGASYLVGPGDLLSVSVYRAADLGGLMRVNSDGKITVPGVGQITVVDKTASQVADTIANALKAGGILLDPNVNVLVTEVRAHLVQVLGQVARPGSIPLDHANMSLTEVLAAAGAVFGTGSGVVTALDPSGTRERFLLAELISGQRDRPARSGEVLIIQSAAVFYISGEVGRAGSFNLERGLTVGQALALGGGITSTGLRSKVKLTRKLADGTTRVFERVDDNMAVEPDDLIMVGRRTF